MFRSEGEFPVTIVEAKLADPKFAAEPAFDVVVHVRTEDGQSDWWRGEVSTNYGKGNFANQNQGEITLKSLEKLGYKFGCDFSQIHTLVGTQTTATVKGSVSKKDGKTYYNVSYLGEGGNAPTSFIDAGEASRRVAAMFGGGVPQQQAPAMQAPVAPPVQAPAAANPFARVQQPAAAPVQNANPFARK
jgi:hypothetical protein